MFQFCPAVFLIPLDWRRLLSLRKRGLNCGSTLNICQDVLKSDNLLHKWGLVDSQSSSSVSVLDFEWWNSFFLHQFWNSCNFASRLADTLWPVLENSVPKLGHEFLLSWLHFHSFFKYSCFKGSKNCESIPSFEIFNIETKLHLQGLNFKLEFWDKNPQYRP